MKDSMDKNGFFLTIKKMAEFLNLKEHEAQEAVKELQKAGRIKTTDIPRKVTVEFME